MCEEARIRSPAQDSSRCARRNVSLGGPQGPARFAPSARSRVWTRIALAVSVAHWRFSLCTVLALPAVGATLHCCYAEMWLAKRGVGAQTAVVLQSNLGYKHPTNQANTLICLVFVCFMSHLRNDT